MLDRWVCSFFRALVLAGIGSMLGVGYCGAGEWKPLQLLGEAGFQHAGTVSEIVALPDGKRVLTASGDGTARLWEVDSGRELQRFERDDSNTVWGVQVLPGGREVLTAGAGGFVTRWEMATGKQLMSYQHSGTAFRMALRPGGKEFVAVDNDNFAILWDLATGAKLRTFKGHSDGVYAAVFVAGGDRLVTGGSDGKLKLWNVDTGKCLKTLKEDFEEIFTIALSPDEKRIVLCSDNEKVCVYDADTLKLVWSESSSGEMKVVAWSPDGTKVAASNDDNELIVWNSGTGKELKRISLPEGGSHRGVAFSADGKEVYAGNDGVLCRYEIASGKRVEPKLGLPVLAGGVEDIAVAGNGRVVMGLGDEDVVQAWETATGARKQRFEVPSESKSLAYSPDGSVLAVGGSDATVAILDVVSGAELRTLRCKRGGRMGFHGRVEVLAFDSAGERLIAGSSGEVVPLWEVKTGKELMVLSGHGDDITDLVFGPGGETVITTSDDKTVRIWEARGGKEVASMDVQGREAENVVSFNGGRSLLVSKHDEELHGFLAPPKKEVDALDSDTVRRLVDQLSAEKFSVRQAASEKLVQQGARVLPLLARMSPDDPEVVFRLREIRGDIRKGAVGSDLKLLHSFADSVTSLAAHPGGAQWAVVVGSGASSRIVIGHAKDEQLEIVQELSDGHGPRELVFSDDGKTLVSGNRDGTISVFALP